MRGEMKKWECIGCGLHHVVESEDKPVYCCFYAFGWVVWREVPAAMPPKLTAEELARRGVEWPEWANWAAVASYGEACFFETEPPKSIVNFCTEVGEKHCEIPGKWDASDWKNSLIRRPEKKLPDWCHVGAWVYETTQKKYHKVLEINGPDNVRMDSDAGKDYRCCSHVKWLREARLRPWTFEEAPFSLKIKADSPELNGAVVSIVYDLIDEEIKSGKRNARFKERDCVYWEDADNSLQTGNFISAEEMMNHEQIDGSPCGILEHFDANREEWVQ